MLAWTAFFGWLGNREFRLASHDLTHDVNAISIIPFGFRRMASAFARLRLAMLGLLLCASPLVAPGVAQSQPLEFEEVQTLFWQGDFDKCIRACGIAVETSIDPQKWFVLSIEAQSAQGDLRGAARTVDLGLITESDSIVLRWHGFLVHRALGEREEAAAMLLEFDELSRYRSWRYRDVASRVAQARYAMEGRADAKEILDKLLRPVSSQFPDDARGWMATADLALANHDYALAATHYRKVVELQPQNPAGHFGLAKAFESSDPDQANTHLQAALQINEDYEPALLYLIDDRINSEKYGEAKKLIERVVSINPGSVDAWSYRSVIAHLENNSDLEREAREKAFGDWKANPRVDHLIGKKLSQKYRFSEGARYQRRALAVNETYLPAKLQLANDLLRLGNDDEGWRLAGDVYREDGYNVVAYNLVTLGREMADFAVLEGDGFILRMGADEAQLFGDQVLDLLVRAKRKLAEKYEMTVSEPVFVEIFPQQKDFAIRTFGMPGGRGFLGVCFGRVITMNSPTSRASGSSNWESVLWHEFCHVVTLQKTNNRMPRWLSEGISVYEELEENATWGQSLSPRYREMLLAPDLTPVSQLSAAFLNPPSPEHLQFAYFESALVVQYLIDEYGLETLRQILDDLALGMAANEVLGRRTGGIELLDREFAEYARDYAESLATGVDWSRPDAELDSLPAAIAWNAAHPNNWYGLRAEAAFRLQNQEWNEAKGLFRQLADLYPDHRADDNAWTMLAIIARQQGNADDEYALLQRAAALSATNADVFRRLGDLAEERDDWPVVAAMGHKLLGMNPRDERAHDLVATSARVQGDWQTAMGSLKSLTLLDPKDPAEAYFRYAEALTESGMPDMARRQLLKCLEEAPRYVEAHRRLRELRNGAAQPENESATEQSVPAGR